MFLVSACLAGVKCRYNGSDAINEKLNKLVLDGKAIPVCPEVLGGLEIPRNCCEIAQDNKAQVISKDGNDFTKQYKLGAKKALDIAKTINAKAAILKSKSPSCGCGLIYDGTFSGKLVEGNGITTELLLKSGLKVYTENDLEHIVL